MGLRACSSAHTHAHLANTDRSVLVQPDASGEVAATLCQNAVVVGETVRARWLQRIRQLCLSFPETSERLSHGAPTFFVRGKRAFLMVLTDHHGDGRLAIWCAAPAGVQSMLVESDPETFFVPPYVGHRGWLGVRLDRGLDGDELKAIAEDAYAEVAPPRLVEAARLAAGERD